MTRRSRQEYAEAVRARYLAGSHAEKGRMLDEFCRATGCHRKAAIRLLHRRATRPARRRGRPRVYGADIGRVLAQLWEWADRPCSKLLAPLLPVLIPALVRHGELRLPPPVQAQLLAVSPATLDRLLQPMHRARGRQPRSPAPAKAHIRHQVPLRTWGEWQGVAPGALQGDLVLHCGESLDGFFLTTLVAVDVATGWTELEAIWGLGQRRVGTGVHQIRLRLPFPLREWHTDNDSQFVNQLLLTWCRREGIHFTRGRGYRKNDQAYVEQRNWLAVRRLVGRDRYASRAAYALLQRLYALLRLQLNFFRPTRKLLSKQRRGAKLLKRYDAAHTPYQRLLASDVPTPAQRQTLERQFDALNPAALARHIDQTLTTLWRLAKVQPPSKHVRFG